MSRELAAYASASRSRSSSSRTGAGTDAAVSGRGRGDALGTSSSALVHEANVHELRATNRGLQQSRRAIVMTWHDDMIRPRPLARAGAARHLRPAIRDWPVVSESRAHVRAVRRADRDVGRRDRLAALAEHRRTCSAELVFAVRGRRGDSPWAVRRACLDRVGRLDEAFVPTGWTKPISAFRIREAGWKVAVHGYERLGAFKHLGSTTFTKYSLNLERDLNNGRLFYGRWHDAIRRGSARARRRWRRPMTAGAWMHTLRMIGNYAVPSRRQAILNGEW